jgi:quercetin dioxygenase-like cupin family protein
MRIMRLDDAPTCEPEPGWRRAALCGESCISIERFIKPPGHVSPRHSHESAQALVVLAGEIRVSGESEGAVLKAGDTAFFEPNEVHAVGNPGQAEAVGLDIFVPGRSFDFWLRRRG